MSRQPCAPGHVAPGGARRGSSSPGLWIRNSSLRLQERCGAGLGGDQLCRNLVGPAAATW